MQGSRKWMMKQRDLVFCLLHIWDWRRLLSNPAGPMSLLNWNCRGLGNPQTINILKKVIRVEDPMVAFLLETKSKEDWVEIVRDQCGFKESFIVPSDGLGGGLALFWKSEIKMVVRNSSLSYIDVVIDGGSRVGHWHLTGFYGHPKTSRRAES